MKFLHFPLLASILAAVATHASAPSVSNPSNHATPGNQTILQSVDSNKGTKWCGHHNGRPVMWMAQMEKGGKVIQGYSFTSGNDVPTRDPKDWTLEGSQDARKWTQLDKRTDEPIFEKRIQKRSYKFKNETAYIYYRFTFQTHDPSHFQFTEIGLDGVTFDSTKLAEPPPPPSLAEARALGAKNSIYKKPQAHIAETEGKDADLKTFKGEIQPLLAEACVGCHGPKKQKGKFRVDTLNPDLLNGGDKDWWLEVVDVLTNGEMPPPDEDVELSDSGRAAIIDWLSAEVQRAAKVARSEKGHTSFRRLTRYEYNYALQDLLGVEGKFAEKLPPETESEDGFKNSSELLQMTAMQFQSYREIGLQALKRATVFGERPKPVTYLISMEEEMEKATSNKKAKLIEPDKKNPTQYKNQLHLFNRESLKGIQLKNGGSKPKEDNAPGNSNPVSPVVMVLPRNNELKWNLDRFLPDEGVMRVSIRAWRSSSNPEEYANLRLGLSAHTSNNANFSNIISERDLPVTGSEENPQFVNFDIQLADIQRNPFRKLTTTFPRRDEFLHIRNVSNAGGKDPLKVIIDQIEITAPFYAQWPPNTHKDLFFSSPQKGDDGKYSREVLSQFMERAWGRPATTQEVDRFLGLLAKYRPDFETMEEAMLEVFATVLAHPNFLYLSQEVATEAKEGPVPLSGDEMARRLSYFLWSSLPDAELRKVAHQGKLRNPEVLAAQVDRMLGDPRAKRFSNHFVSQWLGLDGMESVIHIKDTDLKAAMREEPIAFFEHVLGQNSSVLDFLHSDYAVVNATLSRHYGIRDVNGFQFRKVPVDQKLNRGGLLTSAAVLAMNSDGKDSHPLKRGVWMLERILHDPPPPPPPNVPEVDLADPEIAKMTLKERIANHRDDPACFSCHARIDPWGIAFENYDAMGKFRTSVKGKPVDASAELFNKQPLHGMGGLKGYLLKERQDQFARAMVHKLASYALGRPLSFSDHADIGELTAQFRKKGDGMKDLVHLLVQSTIFSSK